MIPALLLAAALVGPPAPEHHSFSLAKVDKPLAVLMVVDGISTELMLHAHWRELNPLPGMQSRLGRLAWGTAWTLAISWFEDWLERAHHFLAAKVVRWLPRVDEALLSIHNFDLARR